MLAFIDLEERVPPDHPLRTIKRLADEALAELSPTFDAMYAEDGRPSIPPERLLKASLLIALYSVRSERAFCEELEYNLLFRWFLDMDLIEPSFDPTTFTKNRERLLQHEVGAAVLRRGGRPGPRARAAVGRALHRRRHADRGGRQPQELQAARTASRPRRPTTIRATRRSTSTARSARTRPTRARPIPRRGCARRGRARKPSWCFMGHALMENRHGLLVDFQVTHATGHGRAGRGAGAARRGARSGASTRRTLGGDKGYDTRDCVADMRERRVTPHVAQNTSRPAQRHRRADHPPPRLRGQPADPQAGRGDLRLDEDGRRLPPDALPRAGRAPDWPATWWRPPTTWCER